MITVDDKNIIFTLKDDTVVLEINRFDPGKWVEPDRLSPTTLLPEDVPIHCRVCREGGRGEREIVNARKYREKT